MRQFRDRIPIEFIYQKYGIRVFSRASRYSQHSGHGVLLRPPWVEETMPNTNQVDASPN